MQYRTRFLIMALLLVILRRYVIDIAPVTSDMFKNALYGQ